MTAPQNPVFGVYEVGRAYTERRAAYAIILGEAGRVAAVRGPFDRYWLLGGGSLPGESAEETLAREVREEVAFGVRLIDRIGEATQFFYAGDDDRHYQMLASFFRAEFQTRLGTEAEHELCWIPIRLVKAAFFHECHAWAVDQAVASLRRNATEHVCDT